MPFLKTEDITTTIYEYNRGDKMIKADPALIWRRLNIACRELGETFDQLMSKWSESVIKKDDPPEEVERKTLLFAELEPRIEKITRDAFNMPALDDDGNGATVALALATLNEFLTEREKKSENTTTSPSSSQPTDGDQPDLSKEFSESSL